jgi:hypothetical protein
MSELVLIVKGFFHKTKDSHKSLSFNTLWACGSPATSQVAEYQLVVD